MSATVTYKGSTLTTVDNETKKLDTAGTWLEDDITIQDQSSGSTVVVVDTPDSHGGTIGTITAQNVVRLQGAKTVTPSGSSQTITPDTGYDGFESVIVEAIGGGAGITQDENGYIVLPTTGGGGGGSVDSGTVVFSANTTTFSVNLDFEPTVFVFGCPVADVGTSNSWKTFSGAYYDDPNIVTASIKYGTNTPSGQVYAKSNFSYANGQASITLNYPCPAGITYYWMACA